jgi:hypothetical protein
MCKGAWEGGLAAHSLWGEMVCVRKVQPRRVTGRSTPKRQGQCLPKSANASAHRTTHPPPWPSSHQGDHQLRDGHQAGDKAQELLVQEGGPVNRVRHLAATTPNVPNVQRRKSVGCGWDAVVSGTACRLPNPAASLVFFVGSVLVCLS